MRKYITAIISILGEANSIDIERKIDKGQQKDTESIFMDRFLNIIYFYKVIKICWSKE